MQWFKKWDQFINENLFVSKIKDDVLSIVTKCGFQSLNFDSIFELDADQNLEILIQSSEFLKKVQEKQLRATDVEKSAETSSLVINPIQYVLLYNEAETEAANPVYLLIQDLQNDKMTEIKLYYVTENINKFFEYLTNRLIEVKKIGNNKTVWIYKTTNAGENWQLQNKEDVTEDLKAEMYGDELAELEKDSIIKIEIK